MNSPNRVIGFVNAAHFIDHYAMLIFAAAVIVMGPALGMAYSELLPYATPGFVAFGAGSLITGWLGDRWSRRHMMVIFFAGIGASMIAVGFVQTPLQLGAALLAIGLFASIYHPVGTAMIVSYADKLGREMGLNGVWGNLGVASSALVTGVIGQYLGWRWAFIVPGIVTIGVGIAFAQMVVHEDRSGFKQAAAQARVAKQDMWRVILSLLIVVIAVSTTFNAVTVALPKLFAERLADLTKSPALLGLIAAGVYVFGAMTQYTIGKLIDRYSLKTVMLPLSFLLAPFLYLAATLSNLPLILVSIGIVMGAFGQVTVNDAMVGKYTSEEWRSRAYSVRYFIGFTAAGASVGLVAWLYEQGGFVTMLHAFGDAVPAGDRRGRHPAAGDQGAGGADGAVRHGVRCPSVGSTRRRSAASAGSSTAATALQPTSSSALPGLVAVRPMRPRLEGHSTELTGRRPGRGGNRCPVNCRALAGLVLGVHDDCRAGTCRCPEGRNRADRQAAGGDRDQPGGRRVLVDQDRIRRLCRRAGRSRQGNGGAARRARRICRAPEFRADHRRRLQGHLGRHLPAKGPGAGSQDVVRADL